MIEELKQRMLRQFGNSVDKILEGLREAQSMLDSVRGDIVTSGQELVVINTEINSLRDEKELVLRKIRDEKESLRISKEELEAKIVKADNATKNAVKEASQLDMVVKRLSQEKIDIENAIRAIAPMKILKISLEKEVFVLTSVVKNKEAEIREVSDKLETLAKSISEKEHQLSDVENQIGERRKEILPTIQDLNEREKSLKEKESSLAIIEQRYKKLYADKDVGFKI